MRPERVKQRVDDTDKHGALAIIGTSHTLFSLLHFYHSPRWENMCRPRKHTSPHMQVRQRWRHGIRADSIWSLPAGWTNKPTDVPSKQPRPVQWQCVPFFFLSARDNVPAWGTASTTKHTNHNDNSMVTVVKVQWQWLVVWCGSTITLEIVVAVHTVLSNKIKDANFVCFCLCVNQKKLIVTYKRLELLHKYWNPWNILQDLASFINIRNCTTNYKFHNPT